VRTDGFADVWLRGHFAWEYKAPGRSLDAALKQLMMYALPLANPPLLVVSDRQTIELHTHLTGTPSEKHVLGLEDFGRPEVQEMLRWLWQAPERFKPRRSNRDITEEAARTSAGTAERLRAAGVPAEAMSHFLTQCLFCFFAEDVGLLPERLFECLVGVHVSPERLQVQLRSPFETMQSGGLFGVYDIAWFNGGLFNTAVVPPLAAGDVAVLKAASRLNWSAIDATIFGTLFERGLDPAKRSQLGAQFTDAATIPRLVEPVVQRPLPAEWTIQRSAVEAALARSKRHGDKAWRDAQAAFVGFLERLRNYRVLDPACGSGNFLVLALKCLKDIEHRVNLEAEALGLERQIEVTGPHNVLGIEVKEYAAELARVTVWIGELQWRIQRGYGFKLNPVLEPLDNIECRDALMNADGSEAAWPQADAAVGNPPFVGDKKMRGELGPSTRSDCAPCSPGRCRPEPLDRHMRDGKAPLLCLAAKGRRARTQAGRDPVRRRQHFRHVELPLSCALGAAQREHSARQARPRDQHLLCALSVHHRPHPRRHRAPAHRAAARRRPDTRRSAARCAPTPRSSPAPPRACATCATPGSTRPNGPSACPRSCRWAWTARRTRTASSPGRASRRTPPWPPPTAGPTTGRPCPTTRSFAGRWR